jgi:hypothetical protein
MLRILALLLVAFTAQAGPSVEAYLAEVSQLTSAHRDAVTRLTAPANASADALFSGGRFHLSSSDNRAWFYEGIGRAGGLMQTQEFNENTTVRAGDVVWISYTAANYQRALEVNTRLTAQKVVVVAFGPKPQTGRPPFTYWVDSLTSWTADENFVLLGNVLSLWTMEGELAAATARRGKSLVFWQGILVPSGPVRNAHYSDQLFHNGFPQMQAVNAGTLSAAYLDTACAAFGQITQAELPQIAEAGKQVAQRSATGNRPALVVTPHLLPFVHLESSTLFEYIADPAQLDAAIARSRFLVAVGYSGVDLELWRKVRLANANAVWVTGELPNEADLSGRSDIFIDQHWQFGDASVVVPGYDVRLLPVSGIAQLFIYELLVKAAAEPQAPVMSGGPSRDLFRCAHRSARGASGF